VSASVSKPWIERYIIGVTDGNTDGATDGTGDGTGEARGATKATAKKPVVRYAVGYRVTVESTAKPKLVKVRGFEKKGFAETYAENVRAAGLRRDGWRFDDRWRPVHADDALAGAASVTVLALLETFWRMHWHGYSPSSRSKVRGRLLVMAATLLDDSVVARRVVAALKEQSPSRGTRRPEPASIEAKAARYLHDLYLPWCGDAPDARRAPVDPTLEAARTWLERRSLRASAVTDEHLLELRGNLGGRTHSARRTYWSVIAKVLAWAVASGRLERNPALGMPRLSRDLDAEQVDPDRVPGEDEVWQLADAARQRFGLWCAALILVAGYGAMRIGEVLALRRASFERTETGGLRVTVVAQRRRTARRHADDGVTMVSEASPKGRSTGPGARRTFYFAARPAAVIIEHLDAMANQDAMAHLFTGIRGRALDASTFREGRWDLLVDGLFPASHRLAGLDFHALRHYGMTMWLRRGLPLKMIQRWGGWHSLKVMLDVYAAALPDDDAIAIDRLEAS
jgi:integrase